MMRIFLRIAFVVVALACLSRSHAADLFWNDDAGIFRFKDGHIDPTPLFETYDTRGIALDIAANRIWWSDVLPIAGPGPAGVIRTGGTQGGATDVVWQLEAPAGVAIDEGRRRIYWTDIGGGANPSAVYSANFDGSDTRRIISGSSLSEIAGIAIDTARDKLYFSYVNPLIDSLFAGSIARADLDGSNWEPIIGALTKPVGLAIDSGGKELFWADAGLNEGGGSIQAADLDGQDQRTLLGGLGKPQGVALDLAERQVYWADKATGKIQRTDMPGVLPFFEDVLTRLPAPTAIAIHNDPLDGPAWNVDMGGNWSLASNWDPRVPDATDDRAIFGNVITAPRTVTVDRPVTVGRLDFASAHAYTITGASAITLNADLGNSMVQVRQGAHTISAPVSLTDDTVFTVIGADSKLTITEVLTNGTLNLTKAGGGTLHLNSVRASVFTVNGGVLAVGGSGLTSVLGRIAIAGAPSSPLGSLDLTGSALIVDYVTAEQNPTMDIRQWIIAGRGRAGLSPSWTGTGITSSQAATDAVARPNATSVAYADNVTIPTGQYGFFRGRPVDETTVLMCYTRTGDVNLDGVVNDDDVTIVGVNFAPGFSKPHWVLGDFDYSGFVDNDDVTLLGVFYNPSAPAVAVAAVPEPASVVTFIAGCIALLMVASKPRAVAGWH